MNPAQITSAAHRNSSGARLAFVTVKLEGTVERPRTTWSKKDGLKTEMVKEPAGYMVYFPRGHVLRFRDEKELAQHGLDQRPSIINLQGLTDPNSPLGMMLHAQDEQTRHGAYQTLEEMVIRLATAKTGTQLMPEQWVKPVKKAA